MSRESRSFQSVEMDLPMMAPREWEKKRNLGIKGSERGRERRRFLKQPSIVESGSKND